MSESRKGVAVLTCKETAQSLKRLAGRRRVDVQDLGRRGRGGTRPRFTIFMSYVVDIDEDVMTRLKEQASSIHKYLLVTERDRIKAIAERVAQLNIRSPARLHIAAPMEHESVDSMWRRFLSVLNAAPDDHRILDAWWEHDEFVVMSQHFERFRLSLDQLRELKFFKKISRKGLGSFQIDEDGAYVRWPGLDVDLDWNGFCRLAGRVDVGRKLRSQESREAYGDAIRQLREEHGLRQQDIEGLDERHVRRIEKGEVPATVSALKKLADSHMMNVQEYLDELAGLLETD
jgi:hypothetical protein